MKNFEGLGLSPALETSLERMNYTTPTPIQAQAIPLALEGHDIMGSAQTGTGKTAAFAIPLVERLMKNPEGSALVLTPTRELGKQIIDIMHQLLGPKSPIRTAFIIGGEPMSKQYNQLRANPRLIVGTPGRINDHLERGTIKFHDTDFLVLDETDRMLDMGFTVQLEKIFKHMPAERQTLMFSATLPPNIQSLSHNYMNNPKQVSVGEINVVATNIKQEVIRIEQNKKYDELMGQLHERNGSVIVFVKTKFGADRMAKNLRRDGFTSDALHGDLRQNKRDKVMQNFRKMNFRVLVATDIAARGLDVPHIEHVVNYDLPQVAEDFIHRMGRTARAGATGSAISFVSRHEGRQWHAIERLLDPAANDSSPDEYRSHKGSKNKGKPRRSRPGNGDGSFKGKRDNQKRSFGDKPFGDKKRGNRANDRKRFDSESEGQPVKRKFEGKKHEGDKRAERAFESGSFKKKSYKKDSSDKPEYKGKKHNGKPFGEAKFSGKKPGGKPYKGQPSGDKGAGDKAYQGKSGGDKPFKGKKFAGKKFDAKTSDGKAFSGKRSDGKKFDKNKTAKFSGKKGGNHFSKKPGGKPFSRNKSKAA